MSDDVKHSDDELELDTTEPITEGDDVSTDDAKSTEESDDSSASLNLEEAPDAKKTAAKLDQVKGLAAKLLTGELTYQSFPAAQKWLLTDVMDYVSKAQGKGEAPSEKAIDDRVNQLLEDKEFSKKLKEVKEASLSRAENLAITERFKLLRSKGFTKLEALEDSIQFHRIDFTKTKSRQPVMREGNGGVRTTQKAVEDYTIDEINAMTPKQLAKLQGM